MVKRFLIAACLALVACVSTGPGPRPSRMYLPDYMRPSPEVRAEADAGTAAIARAPTVVRMNDGARGWEIEVPNSSGPSEVRIPLNGNALATADAVNVPLVVDGGAPSSNYLLALARVNELYAGQRFEAALLALEPLEKSYPKDARVHAMKGSLLLRLGQKAQAKDAWRKALQLSPGDEALAEALRGLDEEGP